MDNERVVLMKLDDAEGTQPLVMAVTAEQVGGILVADEAIVAKLENVTRSIERVGADVLAAVRRIAPESAVVELGFDLAIESGVLIAAFGKGKADASIKVTLTWSRPPATAGGPPA